MTPASTNLGPSKPRLQVVDYARGLGILLVVFGHTWSGINGRVTLPPGSFKSVYEWVYCFHMPVFFFLSGLFLFRSAQKPAGEFVRERLSRLAWPYLVWTILQTGIQSITGAGDKVPLREWPYVLALDPTGQFWFLYVLFAISIMVLLLVRLRCNEPTVLAISILIYFCARQWGAGLPKPFWQTAMYFPHVALAACVSRGVIRWFETMKIWEGSLLVLAGLFIITNISQRDLGYTHRFDPLTGVVGTIMILALARLCEYAHVDSIRALGVLSMPIYLAHIIASGAVRSLLLKFHVDQWMMHLMAGCLVGIVVPLVLYWIVRKFKIPCVFEFPLKEETRS